MGTRSLTRVFNNDKEILCLYRQMDGYPSGHGVELAEILASGKFVNGIPFGESGRMFNGMGCFAAQMVGALKGDGAGGVYIYPAGSTDCGEEYVYEVRGGCDFASGGVPKPVTVKCMDAYGNGHVLYEGDIAGFKAFCEAPESEEEPA